jgi:asparagine synthase (glutamine-hydrolysing)
MCGITALLSPGRAADVGLVRRMGEVLRHRGPDGEDAVADGPMALFHARLAIIDLTSGAQPMRDGQAVITYNGEIYNYQELRAELVAHGHAFRTTSDTEVILKAYAQWGEDCVSRLNGMFAFVLWDAARGRVLTARDRFGVKPLYWCRAGDDIIWGSEIKALLRHPQVRRAVDDEALHEYLTFQFVLGERTLFRGIHKVEPATLQVVDARSGDLRTRRYWTLHHQVDPTISEPAATARLRELLDDAVRIELRSDVPVGSHLSGGIDSSLLATLAARQLPAPMQAFTGTFREGPEFDETPHARAVAERAGIELHTVVPEAQDLPTLLPKLIWHLDEPAAGPGVLPQFAVSKLAAEHVKVVLGGQGGDEVFGGYTRYLVAYLEQALKGAIYETNEEAEHIVSLTSILPNLPHLQQYVPMLQQFWRSGVFEAMDQRYFRLLDRLGGAVSAFAPDFRASYDREAVFGRFQGIFNHPETRSYYNKMTHFDLVASLPALLQVEDRTSMAVSLESRVPFLDHRLVEFVATLPPALKFRGGEMKYLLKRAARGTLPDSVLDRKDKMGFPVPLHLWAKGPAREFVRDTLLSTRARQRGIADPHGVEQLLDHEKAFSRQSWGLLNLELWFTTFVDA